MTNYSTQYDSILFLLSLLFLRLLFLVNAEIPTFIYLQLCLRAPFWRPLRAVGQGLLFCAHLNSRREGCEWALLYHGLKLPCGGDTEPSGLERTGGE